MCSGESFLGDASGKEPACQCSRHTDMGSIPGPGRSPGEGNGNPLQYSCLENPMDRGAWRATVHEAPKSRIWLKQVSTHAILWVLQSKGLSLHIHIYTEAGHGDWWSNTLNALFSSVVVWFLSFQRKKICHFKSTLHFSAYRDLGHLDVGVFL